MPDHGGNQTYDLSNANPLPHITLPTEPSGQVGWSMWHLETESSSFDIVIV